MLIVAQAPKQLNGKTQVVLMEFAFLRDYISVLAQPGYLQHQLTFQHFLLKI
jgi:hypothetical protein